MSEVTRLLDAAASGDCKAAADLLPLVYDELRKLAAAKMALEKPGHTLDATALVHEAYLRLTGQKAFTQFWADVAAMLKKAEEAAKVPAEQVNYPAFAPPPREKK